MKETRFRCGFTRLLPLLLMLVFSAPGFTADSTEAIIAEVERKQAAAREREYAWTVTEQYLAESRAALAAGDKTGAHAAAQRALLAVDASLQQAAQEDEAWRSRVPGS